MLPDKHESSDDCVGPGKASRVSLFITGTDTGVGKTHIAVQLLRLLHASGTRCAGMKPICCGDRRDAELLLAVGSDGLRIEEINPVWLKTSADRIEGPRISNSRLEFVVATMPVQHGTFSVSSSVDLCWRQTSLASQRRLRTYECLPRFTLEAYRPHGHS